MGHEDAARVLIAHGASVNTRDIGDKARTPLCNAIAEGHQNLVRLLIAHGAEVNYRDEEGVTPLHAAVACGDKAVVELLMTRGASIHAADKQGKTPLHMAAYYGHTAIAELLASVGADPHARAANSQTPLDCAEEAGFADTVAALGGDPNGPSLAGKGPCTIIVTKVDYVEDFLKAYHYDFDNVWIPTQADLVGLESILEPCLRGNPPIRAGIWYGQRQMLTNLRRYSRWCSGFVKDGTRYIVCVMHLDNSFRRPTYPGVACVMDGGWRVLRIIFNLDDGTVAYIECSPSA